MASSNSGYTATESLSTDAGYSLRVSNHRPETQGYYVDVFQDGESPTNPGGPGGPGRTELAHRAQPMMGKPRAQTGTGQSKRLRPNQGGAFYVIHPRQERGPTPSPSSRQSHSTQEYQDAQHISRQTQVADHSAGVRSSAGLHPLRSSTHPRSRLRPSRSGR